jgi:hypothetical protein
MAYPSQLRQSFTINNQTFVLDQITPLTTEWAGN